MHTELGRVLVVAYAIHGKRIGIISARRAARRERAVPKAVRDEVKAASKKLKKSA
jgi:uncharacterized DUF497 family protein